MDLEQTKVLNQIINNNPRLSKEYRHSLTLQIVKSSHKYGIASKLLTAILMQESRYNLKAVHKTCGYSLGKNSHKVCIITDFGISQVHFKNIERFHFNKDRLLSDLEYSVDAGALIMSQYLKYKKVEPKTWWSRYNCGTGKYDTIQYVCKQYQTLVAKRM